MDKLETEIERPAREPLFNAPWPAVAIVALILGSYAWQVLLGGGAEAAPRLGFTAPDLAAGRWWTTLTVMFVHGGWIHAIMNAVAALAFGPPVARLFGRSAGGLLGFFVFYAVCGVFSTLGYAAFHLNDPTVIIGASGAVSGLMGGASRLMGGGDRPAPLFDRQVLGMAAGWTIANLLLGLTGAAPGMDGARIAWEAHVAGYVVGAVLIGLIAPRPPASEST
jgi:membrane associated rhomboid family serine protease